MIRIRTLFLVVIPFLAVHTDPARAGPDQEPIRFARTPDISPDGEKIAFSYLGDVWTVDRIGGIARPVTLHEAHDFDPVFSPDGRWLAFSSNRHGSYDVFVVPVRGGKPRRLTFDSASDIVTGWSPDGKTILFASNRNPDFPGGFELYSIPFEGGRERRLSCGDGKEGVYSPQGDLIAYVRGPGMWYRKGYRGSSNDDVWICNADGSNNRRLTTFNGQDTSPMWSIDGQWIYYVSEESPTKGERGGTRTAANTPFEDSGRATQIGPANIFRRDAAGKSAPQQITFHKEDGVRRARISAKADADGRQWIVYECGPDLWVVPSQGGAPRKLAIEIHADDKVNPEKTVTFTQGASEFALSFDERHVAFVVHGEIFMMPIAGGKATRLTDSPAYDHGIAWAPDSKKIIFASDRSGQEDLYLLEADDPEHKDFVSAHKFKVRQLTNTPDPKIGVNFSPDGKKVAFLRAGKLWTMNPDGTDQKAIVNDVDVFDYDWSPDSKWFVYARQDGSFASELYIVPSAGGESHNITHYATYNGGVTWSGRRDRSLSATNGQKIAFVSQRHDNVGMYVLSLQKPAIATAPESRDIDWDDISERVERAAPLSVEEGAISPDGNRVAFRSTGSSGDDLWVASSSGSQLTRLTTGSVRPQQIQWSQRLPDVIYFRDGHGQIRSVRAGSSSERPSLMDFRSSFGASTIEFKAKMTVRRDEEFREMFEQSWRALREHFYDPAFHGANWEGVRAKYLPLVQHVTLREDLYALMSLMMGELNASHLGILGFSSAPEETTAELGLIFDESYYGPGVKIAEILKRGPADRRGIGLRPGDIIRSIDRVELTDSISVSHLLNDKASETLVLQVTSSPSADMKDPRAFRKVELQAASRGQIHDLMYERWVDHNARRVAHLSGGKLGYIHIPSMDDAGLDRFVRALYSDNFDKEGIVLDVRYNGGGFTHDQILNYLGAREHTSFRQRDGGMGMVLRSRDRKWTKPLVVLINNRSYSDAEIFPSAVRTLGLGKLVGQPTGGHVIGTSAIRLIDGTMFRVPRTGVFTLKGVNMEREGVVPDVEVEDQPDQLAKGIDMQLDKAVDVLKTDVVTWKMTHSSLAVKAGDDGKPAAQATAPLAPPPPAKKP